MIADSSLFTWLGFRWDRASAQAPVAVSPVSEVLASFDRDMARHVWSASVLEGNPFTLQEVRALLAGAPVSSRKPSDAAQVLRLRDAYVWLRDCVAADEFALGKVTSDAIHGLVACDEALEWGHFRGEGPLVTDVSVGLGEHGAFRPPPTRAGGANLREIFGAGLGALTELQYPFERAVAYFLFAVRSQFYFDGNKRTARCLMNGVLLSHGVAPVLVPAEDRWRFDDAIVGFLRTSDGAAVMDLFASCGPRQ